MKRIVVAFILMVLLIIGIYYSGLVKFNFGEETILDKYESPDNLPHGIATSFEADSWQVDYIVSFLKEEGISAEKGPEGIIWFERGDEGDNLWGIEREKAEILMRIKRTLKKAKQNNLSRRDKDRYEEVKVGYKLMQKWSPRIVFSCVPSPKKEKIIASCTAIIPNSIYEDNKKRSEIENFIHSSLDNRSVRIIRTFQ